MLTARAQHTATLLPDGRILVAGGAITNEDNSATAAAELYDPRAGTWTKTGSMLTPRARHSATLLRNGTVLVAGGFCPGGNIRGCPSGAQIDPDGAISLTETYDPKTGRWTAAGNMTTPRFFQTAALLPDGRVLVAGAEHGLPDVILDSSETYDPATRTWAASGNMTVGRTQQFSVTLADGRVLMAGGIGPTSPSSHGELASAERYDPATGKWTATGSMMTARAQGGTAALLPDGRVLIAGGDGPGDPMLASAEIYDPTTGTWTATASMSTVRVESASIALADGRILVAGGFDNPEGQDPLLTSAEVYDPVTATWLRGASLSTKRFDFSLTLLPNGTVLAAGGLVPGGVTPSVEIFVIGP
jgi:N-acetylneuraminic acid mutarotase